MTYQTGRLEYHIIINYKASPDAYMTYNDFIEL